MRYSRDMDKRKKILYIITKSNWGGAQRYVYDLAANLPRNTTSAASHVPRYAVGAAEVDIRGLPGDQFEAVVAAGGSGRLFDMLASAGVRTIAIPSLDRDIHIYNEWQALWHLFKIIKKEQPDVVHLNSSKIGGLGALAAFIYKICKRFQVSSFKFQVIFTAHGWGFHEDRSWPAKAAIFFVSWFSALFQDRIIVLNKADFTAAEKFIPHRRITLIPNGILPIDFIARAEARALLAEKIRQPIEPDAILIGAIAELTKNKGLSYLIGAVNQIRFHASGFRFQVILIGTGEEKENLQKQIDALNLNSDVFLAGFIPDASRYLKAFDVFALPSLKEGSPFVVLEAMAAGLPIAASRVGGLADLIEHEKEGLLVPPKDAKRMSEALASLITSPEKRRAYGDAAAKKQETNFSFHAMLEHTIRIYLNAPTDQ